MSLELGHEPDTTPEGSANSEAAGTADEGLSMKLDATKLPVRLYEMLLNGDVVLLSARTSSESGVKAMDDLMTGYTTAVRLLDQYAGCDIGHLLPAASELLAELRANGVRISPSVGPRSKPFVIHSWVYDAQIEDGFVLLFQWGSGRKVDDRFEQPVIENLADTIVKYEPVLTFGSEIRSFGRGGFTMRPLDLAMQQVGEAHGEPVYIAERRMPVRPYGPEVSRELFQRGVEAEDEAEAIFDRVTAGMLSRTDDGPVSGLWRWGMAMQLPPPLATCRMNTSMERYPRVAYVDTPAGRPAPGEVVKMPRVLVPGTEELADQVEALRAFYELYLTEGWNNRAMAELLVSMGFSTDGIRRRRGDGAVATLRPGTSGTRDAASICAAIWRYREFHVTGTLEVSCGEGLTRQWQVRWPDGQPIATREQVDRIEAAKEQLASLRPRTGVATFSGTPCVVDGAAAILVPSRSRVSGELVWRFERLKATSSIPYSQRHAPCPPLTNDRLVAMVARGLSDASVSLRPLRPAPDEVARAHAAHVACVLQVETAREALGRAERHVTKPELSGAALTAASAAMNAATRKLSHAIRAERESLVAAEDARNPVGPTGLALREIFDFAAALNDPWSGRYRATLRNCISDVWVRFTRPDVTLHFGRCEVEFGFTINLVDERGRVWQRKVEDSWTEGRGLELARRTHQSVLAMAAGTPLLQTTPGSVKASMWRPWVRGALGLGDSVPSASSVCLIRDRRLLRLTMAALFPVLEEDPGLFLGLVPADLPTMVGPALDGGGLKALAERTGEPLALIERLVAVHSVPRTREPWLRGKAVRLEEAVVAAREAVVGRSCLPVVRVRDGFAVFDIGDEGARLTACSVCGSRRRFLPRLKEMWGLVCGDCRRDDTGLVWEADPYDRWLV